MDVEFDGSVTGLLTGCCRFSQTMALQSLDISSVCFHNRFEDKKKLNVRDGLVSAGV